MRFLSALVVGLFVMGISTFLIGSMALGLYLACTGSPWFVPVFGAMFGFYAFFEYYAEGKL